MSCAADTRRAILLAFLPAKITSLSHVMDRVEELLCTPAEAIIKAAAAGDECEMWELVDRFPEHFVEALKRDDHSVNKLLRDSDCEDVLSAPTEIAASRGFLRVVKYLVWSTNYTSYHEGVCVTALMAAARNGHADVVEFAANDADGMCCGYEVQPYHLEDALYYAIAGGHASVVEVLLKNNELECSLDQALEQANARGEQSIIDMIDAYASYCAYSSDSDDSDSEGDSDNDSDFPSDAST